VLPSGIGEGGTEKVLFELDFEGSFWGDKNVLELSGSDSCTTL